MIWKVNGYSDCSSFLLDEYEDKKMSRFCEQCGKRLEVNENFCPSCGAKVFNEELRAQPPPPKTTSPPVIDNSFGKLIMGILGGIGIIFFIIVVIAGSSSQNSTSEKYDTPTRAPVETAKPPDPLTESDLRIGDLSLTSAANKTELDRRFGAGKVRDNGWYDYGDFWAKFDSGGNVYWLSYMNSNHSTPRGIHCGSTLAEIESAYGKNYLREENDYEYDIKNTSLIFHIGKKTGKVEEIVLVKKIQEPKPPVGKTNTPAGKPKPPTEKSSSDEYNYSCTVNGEKAYKGINRLGLACALYSVEKQKRITSDFGSNHTARGTFYIVTVIVGNSTNEPIFAPSIYLMDEHGRKFSSDISAESTWETVHGAESAFQLNPGQPGWVYKVFDIPDDANITNLRCETAFSLEENNFNVPFRVVTE